MGDEVKPRIEQLLGMDLAIATGVPWIMEYKPSDNRAWKIDLALPTIKLAVEIDGRFHSRAAQHVSDCEKSNFLVSAGWRVLRYPASRVLAKKRRLRIVEQISRVMCGVCCPESDECVLTGE